jgi:putative transposase
MSIYHTDLSDAEWICLGSLLPPPKTGGRPRTHSLRAVLNAIFYVLRSGCPWRLLPRDFPPWKTVYHYFRIWRIDGTFEQLNAALRERLRIRLGRNAQPSVAIVDSQSAKTTGVGGEARGRDLDPSSYLPNSFSRLLVNKDNPPLARTTKTSFSS